MMTGMRSYMRVRAVLFAALAAALLPPALALPKLLVFTKVSPGAYTHESIPTAVDVITRLGDGTLALNDSVADAAFAGSQAKWVTVHDDDDSKWEEEDYLNQYDAVAFVMTR